jgi:FkbM family methyltransferase
VTAQARWYLDTLPLSDAVVCDVGATVGELSSFFLRAGARRVLSVEPLDENLAALDARIAAEALGDRWTLARCAASDHRGVVHLTLGGDEETAHNSRVVTAAGAHTRAVPCETLPVLCPDATVVKLDIEGHEYPVLDHALAVMTAVRAWAIELHMTPGRPLQAVIQQLAAQGFRVFGAGRRASDPQGPWVTAEVPPTLAWENLPVAARRADGSVFKMLHVVARR